MNLLPFISAHATAVGLTAAILCLVALVTATVAIIQTLRLRRRLTELTRGADGASLEDVIARHGTSIETLDSDLHGIYGAMNDLRQIVRRSVYKKGILRYNPFKDLGGDQSFAIALLDGDHNGVVISSLHTREGTRVYAKPVSRGTSETHQLSDEERQVITQAIGH